MHASLVLVVVLVLDCASDSGSPPQERQQGKA